MAHGATLAGAGRAVHRPRPAARTAAGTPLARRLAGALCATTFALLAVGGIVTSRDAGMVFPDWPLSNGSLNPEGWLANADMLSEHGHRILGALAGLLAVGLAVVLHRREARPRIRALGWIALAFVVAQGLLGGFRVIEAEGLYALVHGCTGQLFFAVTVALVFWTGPAGRGPVEAGAPADRLLRVAAGALLALGAQLLLGADLRHAGGPVHLHALGAAVVSGMVLAALTVALLGHGRRAALRRPALALAALILLQIGLGLLAARALGGGPGSGTERIALLLPSLHQAAGALVLAAATWLVLAAWRRRAAATGGRR